MIYYLDCEFDGFKGALLSLALVCEDGRSFYGTLPIRTRCDPWVVENVVPKMYDVPAQEITQLAYRVPHMGKYLQKFFEGDAYITVLTDWPDDIKYFCEQIITGPGEMIAIPGITFEVMRVDAYPTKMPGAVQHNAWWDAQALRYYLTHDDRQQELDL